ncbi:LysR substrate-binding domain-containing protein [Hoeflea sp. E7-10]|uniref:LysR substrate-binding domain-containing protein n=2 Tax=Hoeflea poritis TaxID=2993659 RepID=A0ABT4VM52_9HYPH|nr:LysR substrate-binding domain-containing protein [Hoeflea poritis]MDA4845759.1 LysR substrate-binding domain-containing protein [Hoeflea poritis]
MQNKPQSLPPLSRLRPFEAAARRESFSRAADELGMTQTAVSKQVARLEQELGTRLFERRNRAVFLTDEGRRFGRVVSAALSDIAEEVASLRGARRASELVLHCQLCEAFYWLMPRLNGFHELHPGVELRVLSSLRPITEATEHFDVAMQTSGRPFGSARLALTASDDIFPVCAPGLVSLKDRPLRPEDLVRYPLLSHNAVPQDWMEWPDWFEAVAAKATKPGRVMHFDSYPLALQAAVSGQGIALGWKRTTQDMIEDGKLIRPCREYVSRPAEISVFRGPARETHRDTEKLVAWLSDQLSEGRN